jgi:hypothetical protein
LGYSHCSDRHVLKLTSHTELRLNFWNHFLLPTYSYPHAHIYSSIFGGDGVALLTISLCIVKKLPLGPKSTNERVRPAAAGKGKKRKREDDDDDDMEVAESAGGGGMKRSVKFCPRFCICMGVEV